MADQEPPYKRFLLFGYDSYYPGGGEADVLDSFDSLAEAKTRMEKKDRDYYEVLDLEERRWVA